MNACSENSMINFQPCFLVGQSTRNHVFSAGNYMGRKDIECGFYDGHFQPSICDQNFIFKSEKSSHTPSLCLVEDNFLLKQPTPSIFWVVNNILFADQPLERRFEDIFQVDKGLPCTFSKPYFIPLQQWTELACVGTCYTTSNFCISCHACNINLFCSCDVPEIPAYIHVIMDATLFWIIAKHKGRIHGIEEMFVWLHWLFDFT